MVKLLRFSLLLALCLPASAQHYQYAPVTKFASGSSTNTDWLTGLAWWWIASDLSTNSAISGNWTDRVQSASFHMAASANQPTNSAGGQTGGSGVWFDASHFLTNNNETCRLTNGNMNVSMGFIIYFQGIGSGVQPGFFSNGAQYGSADSTVLGYNFAHGNNQSKLTFNNNAGFADLSDDPFSNTNFVLDLVISQVWTNSLVSGAIYTYTNGQQLQKLDQWTSPHRWGSTAERAAGPNLIGLNWARSSSAPCRIKEILIWTNGTESVIASNVLFSFHKYATNTYAYTP